MPIQDISFKDVNNDIVQFTNDEVNVHSYRFLSGEGVENW